MTRNALDSVQKLISAFSHCADLFWRHLNFGRVGGAILALIGPGDRLNKNLGVYLEVSFEVRDAVMTLSTPGLCQHFNVREFKTGLLVKRQSRSFIQILE